MLCVESNEFVYNFELVIVYYFVLELGEYRDGEGMILLCVGFM